MAYATQMTISTGNKVSLNYQSQEVSVTLTYQLERADGDVQAVVREKTAELAQAHQAAWQILRDAKVAATGVTTATPVTPRVEAAVETEVGPLPANDLGPTKIGIVSGPAEGETPPSEAEPNGIEPNAAEPPATTGQALAIARLLNEAEWSDEQRQAYLRERYDCGSLEALTAPQATHWLLELQRASRLATQQQRLEASLNGAASKRSERR